MKKAKKACYSLDIETLNEIEQIRKHRRWNKSQAIKEIVQEHYRNNYS